MMRNPVPEGKNALMLSPQMLASRRLAPMKELTEVTKRIEARPSERPPWELSTRSELMVCEAWPMVMSLSCVWVPMHGCQTEAAVRLFHHKLYMSVSEAWQLGGFDDDRREFPSALAWPRSIAGIL
jgi:hypothetical protein